MSSDGFRNVIIIFRLYKESLATIILLECSIDFKVVIPDQAEMWQTHQRC